MFQVEFDYFHILASWLNLEHEVASIKEPSKLLKDIHVNIKELMTNDTHIGLQATQAQWTWSSAII